MTLRLDRKIKNILKYLLFISPELSVPARKSANKIGGLLIVMPAKAGIQVCDFSGFRVAPGLRRGCPE